MKNDSLNHIEITNKIDSFHNSFKSIDSTLIINMESTHDIRSKFDSIDHFQNELKEPLLELINHLTSEPAQQVILGIPLDLARILIPAIVTVSIFILGQFVLWTKTKLEKWHEVTSYRNLILNWSDLIEKAVNQQISGCRLFTEQLEKSDDLNPQGFQYNRMHTDKILDISIDKYISCFVTNSTGDERQKEKWCYNLISQYNFFLDMEDKLPDTYKTYQKQTLEIMEEWNEKFSIFDDITSRQSQQVNANPEHENALIHKRVMQIANSWRQSAEPTGRSVYDNTMSLLIIPLANIINDEFLKHPSNSYVYDLSKCLQDIKIVDLKHKANKEGNIMVFNRIADTMTDSFKTLIETKNSIQSETSVKRFWTVK